VTGQEIPYLIAGRLGAGCSSRTSSLELWSQLQDHAESAQRMRRRVAFLLDDVDRADESALPALGRLIELFGASGSWLFSARSAGSSGALRVLADRLWLRIELPPLSRQVAQQVLARELAHGTAPARLTPEAVEAAHELAAGRIRRLRQLAELASLTAEAEQRTDITADLIRALGEELAR
jgi:type II secretory pathway predicted ATPase ExeA